MKDNQEMSSELKTIKSDIKRLYDSVDSHLSSLDTFKSETNRFELSEQTLYLFESTKRNAIKICRKSDLIPLLDLINDLSLSLSNQI